MRSGGARRIPGVARSAQSDPIGLRNRWNFRDQVTVAEQSANNAKNHGGSALD